MTLLYDMENIFYTFEQIDKSMCDDLIQNIIPEQKKPFKKLEFKKRK